MSRHYDEEREHRIHYEIIVDAYDEYEQAMGWYIHMNDNLAFPMQAKVKLRLRGGKTEEKAVKIVEVDPLAPYFPINAYSNYPQKPRTCGAREQLRCDAYYLFASLTPVIFLLSSYFSRPKSTPQYLSFF